ncbi:MAG TPA: redoxin domain-containing protein [Selenomonadales bacterium]|nr:redoxin domain-containing protein [Selenomonadales bacterium]
MPRRWMINGLIAVLFSVGTFYLAACGLEKPPAAPPAERGVIAGKLAPEFSLQDLDGKQVAVAPGKVTVLNFWATWCPPCQAELPELQKFVDAHRTELAFYGVNIQDPPENARSFMQRKNYNIPVLLDTDGKVAETYRVNSIPTTIVLDKEGIVRYRKTGAVTMSELEGAIKGL